jgi:hypothetical protein
MPQLKLQRQKTLREQLSLYIWLLFLFRCICSHWCTHQLFDGAASSVGLLKLNRRRSLSFMMRYEMPFALLISHVDSVNWWFDSLCSVMLDSILVYKYVQFFTYISLIWDNWIKVKLLPSSSYCLTNFDFPPKLQVAEIIKEDLWPNPLKYFNNVLVF